MCSSTEVLTTIQKVKAKEYWGYPKKGTFDKGRVRRLREAVKPAQVIIPLQACNLWNAMFLELGGKHRNVSTGMAAIIIALELKRPEKLYLAGFDKVLNPETPGYACTVPTDWNKNGTADTGHDWFTEKKLLDYLAAHYKTKIINLARSNDVSPSLIQPVRA